MTRTKEDLRELQALPLELKILKTKNRIKEFYDFFGGQVYCGMGKRNKNACRN